MGQLTTTTLTFDEWAPDTAPLTGGATLLQGVLPAPDGYAPLPVPVVQGPAGPAGGPPPGPAPDGYAPLPVPVVQGPAGLPDASLLIAATTPDGFTVPMAFARAGIYRASPTAWVGIGRAAGYAASVPWAAVRWGDIVIAA